MKEILLRTLELFSDKNWYQVIVLDIIIFFALKKLWLEYLYPVLKSDVFY